MNRFTRHILAPLLLAALLAGGCDTAISGEGQENRPPTTALSVRDTSLVDNLGSADRLASSVVVAWSGEDPDGYVAAFEVRFYDRRVPPPAEWTRTTSRDTLVLLPIQPGSRTADVVFEVRAVDNEGLADPDPARTVFPIQNAPPDLRLLTTELPPDTTFTVFSFSWEASDPEGEADLSGIEVSFNDSLNFTALPPDLSFATFVANVEPGDGQTTASARVFSGRSFQSTGLDVPGLRLDAENTIYIRAQDRTDTTSAARSFTWFVRKQNSRVLYVNDYRKESAPIVQAYHLELLHAYLPPGTGVDVWDVSRPYATGTVGAATRSDALPRNADPTLRRTLALYDYIYWVTTSSTNSSIENNLPFAASVMDLFFEQGGKLMVHSPVVLPFNPDENNGNNALLTLPITDLIVFPDSLLPFLRLPSTGRVQPAGPVPGLDVPLPELKPIRLISGTLPYISTGDDVPLYRAQYNYITRVGNRQRPWTGPDVVASISADRRVALMALPLVDERDGSDLYVGADDDPEAPRRAVFLLLEALGFPKR